MIKFYMYRLKIDRDVEPTLFPPPRRSQSGLIEGALFENPSTTLRRGQEWLVGNVEKPSEREMFFSFGKITQSVGEKYDYERKEFVEVSEEQAPYTFVGVNLRTQVCAVVAKVKIAPQVATLATRLSQVLNHSKTARENNINFELAEIQDAEPFLKIIDQALTIKKFELTFSRPNPWDVEKDFHKPQEEYLKKVRGKKGKTTIDGENLDKDVIKDTVKSVASTGDNASVVVRMPGQRSFQTKRLSGNQATTVVSEIVGNVRENIKKVLFPEIQRQYALIRGKDEGSSDRITDEDSQE